MKIYDQENMHKEFKLGMLAGITLVLGVGTVIACVYIMFNPQILG